MLDLENMGRLGPLVFDEVHKLLTDSTYRTAFEHFHVLNKLKTVIFGLTGTLPPHLYAAFCEFTQMTWKIIRTPTWRKELKYDVVKIAKENQMNDMIYTHLQKHLQTYRAEDRAIIFCRDKRHVCEIAALFNVKPFYAPGVDDNEMVTQNEETMKGWLAGKNKVMVSTSYLGCGLDCAHIRDVIHRDPSYTMIDQDQEDGRGGRDGLETRATIFVVKSNPYKIPSTLQDRKSVV